MRIHVGSAASTAAAVATSVGWALTARRLCRRTAAWRRMCQDPVTSLWTRAAWQDAARPALSAGQVVGLLDLDRFKRINDRAGHRAGDAVLRAVAAELAGALPPEGLAGRYGGDELVFVAPLNTAELAALQVRLAGSAQQAAPSCALPVGVSVGGARLQHDHADLDEAVALADAQMYRAKRGGTGWCLADCPPPNPGGGGCLPWPRRAPPRESSRVRASTGPEQPTADDGGVEIR